MNLRRMGETGIECSMLGLGTGRLASASGGLSRAGASRLIGVAADYGINLIDTADSYGQGESEELIGVALSGKRERFIIVTKAGYHFSRLGGGLRLVKPLAKRVLKLFKGGKSLASSVRSNIASQNFSADYIENCVHGSLQRLRTDYLDIFLLHCPPAQVVVEGELFDTLRRLKQQGKIRHFGVSSPEPAVLHKAAQARDVAVLETPVNPSALGLEQLSKLHTANKGIIANQIFLAGKLLENERGEVAGLKNTLSSLAAKRGVSLNRLLIQYALSRPGVSCAITGTNNPEHLKQNVADALAPAALSVEEFSMIGELKPLHS